MFHVKQMKGGELYAFSSSKIVWATASSSPSSLWILPETGRSKTMKCKKPFLKSPVRHDRVKTVLSGEARIAMTPFPCGQCLPCRINKARMWTARLLLEQMDHEKSCFLTLTYNEACLPKDGSLEKDELQKYLKRLRSKLDTKIRYFAVGEYGDKTWRPHYHLAVFGIGIESSKQMEEAWQKGFIYVGDLNKDSARYMTGYIVKKLTKKDDPRLFGRKPEFMTSSRKDGGIGKNTVLRIAEEMKSKVYFKTQVMKVINYGGRELPLGRYLSNIVNDALGSRDLQDLEWYQVQEDLFDRFMEEGEIYSDTIQRKMKASVDRCEKLAKIKKQGKKL